MYDISFHWQFLARVCSIKQEPFVWKRKGIPNRRCYPGNWAKYKILHIYFSRLLLNFKSTFKIKKFMNDFWNDFRRTPPMAASTSMFYFAIDYKNEPNMKVAASNVNIKYISCFLDSEFLVSEWSLYSGKPQGTLHELAPELRVEQTCENNHKVNLDLFNDMFKYFVFQFLHENEKRKMNCISFSIFLMKMKNEWSH